SRRRTSLSAGHSRRWDSRRPCLSHPCRRGTTAYSPAAPQAQGGGARAGQPAWAPDGSRDSPRSACASSYGSARRRGRDRRRVDEAAVLGGMRHGPAEVALDGDDLAVTERLDLGVPETAALALTIIGNDHPVAGSDEVHQLELADHGTVGP